LVYLFFYWLLFNEGQDRKFVNEFLNLGVGANAQGMMGAVSASGMTSTGRLLEPGRIAECRCALPVAAMHAEWFAGIAQYDYLSFGKNWVKAIVLLPLYP
jgi:hypothetical protein